MTMGCLVTVAEVNRQGSFIQPEETIVEPRLIIVGNNRICKWGRAIAAQKCYLEAPYSSTPHLCAEDSRVSGIMRQILSGSIVAVYHGSGNQMDTTKPQPMALGRLVEQLTLNQRVVDTTKPQPGLARASF